MLKKYVPATLIFFLGVCGFVTADNHEFSNAQFQIKTHVLDATPSGGSHDGFRIYLLPWETTTVNPPDLAVCLFRLKKAAQCIPDYSAKKLQSNCPDNPKCTFVVSWSSDEIISLAFFDIDALGKKTIDNIGNTITNLFKGNEVVDQLTTDVLAANDRRWSWIESVVLIPLGSSIDQQQINQLQDHVRNFVIENSPPSLFTNISEGRLAGPFEVQPLENCLEPGPGCSLNYMTFSINDVDGHYD